MPLKAEKKLDAILELLELAIIELSEVASILRREFNPPVRIQLSVGGNMADIQFTGVQTSTVTITLLDIDGNAVSGALIDAGSLVASFADGTTSFTLAPGAATSSFTVTSVEGAAPITDDVLTVNGNFNGVPLTAGTLAFDIVAATPPADTPVSISLSASTPS